MLRHIAAISFFFFAIAAVAATPTVILVDKSHNLLHLARYQEAGYQILKSFHATVGKVKGDKRDQDDLKTPEGVYHFTSLLRPPSIKPKFGVMAFYMNYPNPYDRIAGHTGFDIMLHATNEPERLKNDFDSEGCIVVKNEDIQELENHIQVGLTPILVFEELEDRYKIPGSDEALKKFFNDWIMAWETKNLEDYIAAYHTAFESGGKNREQWKSYKGALNRKYHQISVDPSQVQYFRHPKYSVIMFQQNYTSRYKSGKVAFVSTGTKTLYVAEEEGKPKIIAEDFSNRKW